VSAGTFDDRRESIAAGGKPIVCPYCGSRDTRRTAEFGPFHMTEQYHCLACKSPFSLLRDLAPPEGTAES
jgi:DNA-directed RNA polymerase subunit RPC12/RpoP